MFTEHGRRRAYAPRALGCASILALATAATAMPAQASEPPALSAAMPEQAASDGQSGIRDIVVTATKRAGTAQSLATAIITIDPAKLAQQGVTGIGQINKVLPDVRVDTVIGAANISIRGIRASSVSPTADIPASVHLDGVYLARAAGVDGLFYDLQRIEALPGPQGTLYGRNATSGVINIIPMRPTDQLGASAELELGNYNMVRGDGMVNVPLGEKIAARAAVHYLSRDGYFSNGMSDAGQFGARLSLRLKASDTLTVTVSGDYERTTNSGIGQAVVGATYGSPPPNPLAPQVGQAPRNYTVPSDPFKDTGILYPLGRGNSANNSRLYGAMAEAVLDMGASAITGQFGYRHVGAYSNNISLSSYNANDPTGIAALPTDVGQTISTQSSETYSAELRIASKGHAALQYVGGVFFMADDNESDFCQMQSLQATSPAGCTLNAQNPNQRARSYAAFGEATWTPAGLSALHLTAGARYNIDRKRGDALLTSGTVVNNQRDLSLSFKRLTYKLNASYDVAAHNMVYAQYSTGFRAGGIAFGSMPIYKPETIGAIEIGSKNRFLNNRLQINLAAWDYRYHDVVVNLLQVGNVATSGPPMIGLVDLTVTNIGRIHYQGASIDTQFEATRNDRLAFNVQFLRGRYGDYVFPSQFVVSQPLDMTGTPTGQSGANRTGLEPTDLPHWSGNAAYEHTFDVFSGALTARAATQFSAKRHISDYDASLPGTIQYKYGTAPAYARFDLSLGFAPDHGRWHLKAYVNNVFNAVTYSNVHYESQQNQQSGLVIANLYPPRTFGLIAGIEL